MGPQSSVQEQATEVGVAAIAMRTGGAHSFTPIVTRRGETLHNHFYEKRLMTGNLLLVDCGAETENHYASDNTRTVPVDGKFTPTQHEVYEIEVCKMLAASLKGLGLLKGEVVDAVRAGAFPSPQKRSPLPWSKSAR